MRRLLSGLALLALIAHPVAADDAVLLSIKGHVTVAASGSSTFLPAVTGQRLAPGDVVVTGADGEAIVLDEEGSRIDLFPNSTLTVTERADGTGPLRRLWRAITAKFSDSEASSAQAGRVGALRAPEGDEEMFNDYATQRDLDEMRALLDSIGAQGYPAATADLMRAVVYEMYGQYIPAEAIYLARIDTVPEEPVTYDMLLDMYIKMDLYGHAAGIRDLKAERLPAGK